MNTVWWRMILLIAPLATALHASDKITWGIVVHFEAVGAVAARQDGKPMFPAV